MEDFINNIMNMIITFSYPGDTSLYYRDDKVYALLLDVVYSGANITHKITYQPTYTNRINNSGAKYEYDGRKNKLEYIVSSDLLGINILSGLDYLKKSADMTGTLADKEIHSIFSEFRNQTIKLYKYRRIN